MSDTSKSLMSRHEYLIGSARAFVPPSCLNRTSTFPIRDSYPDMEPSSPWGQVAPTCSQAFTPWGLGIVRRMAHARGSRLRFPGIEIRDMEREELIETSRLGMKWESVPGV